MKLVERHVISKLPSKWSEIDILVNLANYHYRQYFFENKKKLSFKTLYHLVSKTDDYQALQTQVSKQIIRRLELAWRSYYATLKEWQKKTNKFLIIPKITKYKKTKYRNIIGYYQESIYKKTLKKGIGYLSMSELKIPRAQRSIREVRIVPQSSCYLIEILNKKEKRTTDSQQVSGISLGINNSMAVTTNKKSVASILVNGRPLKAINTFYHKKCYLRQSQLKTRNNQTSSNRLNPLTHKRNCRGKKYLHTASKRIIDWCQLPRIEVLIIGHNDKGKQSLNLGKKNNKQFVSIPHYRLREMLNYKAQLKGAKVIITEESYRYQSNALDGDDGGKYGEKKPMFKGKRVTRRLSKTGEKKLLNADINGTLKIIRKGIPDVFDQGIKGLPFNPVVLDALRMAGLPDSLGKSS
ncbi:MAG: IS200/IS605 family element transposase accessory protein TnpB [Moorea sp. SIO2B7]|nr:IS200/IS605 family element transposase accessory protein TnpB [Moorena sp. SIO2B7]